MFMPEFGLVVAGGAYRSSRRRAATLASTLLPSLALLAFCASQASAGTVVDLGSAYVTGKVDARTCFDGPPCTEQTDNLSGNEYVASPYSSATTTLHLTTAPSMTATAEADALKGGGGGASPNFVATSSAQVTLDYYFAIVGPDDIKVPVNIVSNGTMTITGDISDGSGAGALNNLHIAIEGPGLEINRYASIQFDHDKTGALDVNQTSSLQTNTLYSVGMLINAYANVGVNSPETIVAISTMDPAFTIADSTGRYSAYSIAYSSSIGAPSPTPLPATLPLFTSAIGGLGYLGYRKRKRTNSA